jgi:hypothetical protein
MPEDQQEENFRRAFGDEAWEAIKAESVRLGRKLTGEEAAVLICRAASRPPAADTIPEILEWCDKWADVEHGSTGTRLVVANYRSLLAELERRDRENDRLHRKLDLTGAWVDALQRSLGDERNRACALCGAAAEDDHAEDCEVMTARAAALASVEADDA